MKKKENGSGGFTYAMCFIGIITVVLLYTYTTFISNLYIVESVMENGLHLVENIVLTSNQSIVTDNDRSDAYERERRRTNIVTECIYSNIFSNEEKKQVKALGELFQNSLIEQFDLKDNTHPSSGILKSMCGEDSDIKIDGDVIIYEPIYKLDISSPRLNPNAEAESDPKYVSKKWIFDTDYIITGWVQYRIQYKDNVYNECFKNILYTQPVLKNGDPVEGATIEATVALSLKGVKNAFVDINTSNTGVSVTQAVDIVIADKDSRKR